MSEGYSTRESIRRIQQRRREEAKRQRMRNLVFLGIVIVVIILIVFAIRGMMNIFKGKDEVKRPDPVNLMLYNAKELPDTENENFIYTEPLPRAQKHIQTEDDEFDRLSGVGAGGSKNVCYLTFDDGPNNSITPQVLDVLRRYDIKATFFMVGTLLEENSDMARRVHEEGHLLANHTYSHVYKDIYSSTDAFMSEVEQTEELILEVLDSEEQYFPLVRFPGGSYETGTYKEQKKAIKEHMGEVGFYHCDWNSLNGDADGTQKDADGLVEYFKKNTSLKKNAVVLMHDTVSKQATVDALPQIIEYMLDNGYVFLRLDEEFTAQEN